MDERNTELNQNVDHQKMEEEISETVAEPIESATEETESETEVQQNEVIETSFEDVAPEETEEKEESEKEYTYQNPNPFYNENINTVPVFSPKPPKEKKNGLLITLIVIASAALCAFLVLISMQMKDFFTQTGGLIGDDKNPSSAVGESNDKQPSGDTETDSKADIVINDKPSSGALSTEEVCTKLIDQVVGVVVMTGEGFTGASSQGSGIIISEDGYVVTNAHVVEGATSVQIVLNDDTTYDAKIVGSDNKTDLAVLKVEAKGLNAADFGDSSALKLGESVIAIGNPYGLELSGSVTKGIVSALEREIVVENYQMKLLQTDAAINPGNSGGALVNMYGQVIGINSSKIISSDAEGLGFAIPVNEAKPIIDALINYGYVKGRPMLGITGGDVTLQMMQYYNLPQGVYVSYVDPESSAYKNGLRENDIITAINGVTITSFASLDAEKDKYQTGDTVKLSVYRYSTRKTMEVNATLEESTGS